MEENVLCALNVFDYRRLSHATQALLFIKTNNMHVFMSISDQTSIGINNLGLIFIYVE